MIVDLRTYRIKPNKMPQELDLYEKHGLAPQVRHLGSPLAYLYGESGDINTVVIALCIALAAPIRGV
jgi:hypothetical protein